MYIWVILATFIAILYSFSLAPREDMRDLYVTPRAEAVISRLVIQHKAGMNWVFANTPPQNGSTVVTYTTGEIMDAQDSGSSVKMEEFLPIGFNKETGFTTEIYCVDKENHDSAKDCASQDARRYLITYGPIDARWINRKSGHPGNDLLSAMNNVMGNTITFGYTVIPEDVHPDTGDIQGIASRENVQIYIPNYIYRNGEYAKACGNKDTAAEYCLVYITPY